MNYTQKYNGDIEIVDESHYYPPDNIRDGLEHTYYDPGKKEYKRVQEGGGNDWQIKLVEVPNSGYQYKYQGQERQDELDLNWDSFKYRNYDYAIGRFMSVDPLAEKYPYNSTYAFAENKVIQYNELEGLEIATPIFYSEVAQKTQSFFDGLEKVIVGATNEVIDNATPQIDSSQETSEPVISDNTQMMLDGASQMNEALPDAPEARDVADAAEIIGDGMVVGSLVTGPAAPIVSGTGDVISTVGTGANVVLDLVDGDYRSAAKRTIIEGMSGGLSKVAKNAPGVDETAEYIIDVHILFYENVVVPMVDEKSNKK